MDEAHTTPGTSRRSPDVEVTLLQEEQLFLGPTDRFTRVLTLFEIRRNGVPIALNQEMVLNHEFDACDIVGVVGTIIGKEGLFAQCGWFGNHDLDWFWCRIDVVRSIQTQRDRHFRNGELCVWLETPHGDYAMLLPHKDFIDMWEESLDALGQFGHAAKFQQWPLGGTRPLWWEDHWQDSWPFDKAPSHTTAPMDVDEHMAHDSATESRAIESTATTRLWRRLGPRGDTRHPGEPRAHLHQRDPWFITPDTGLLPTRGEHGETP